MVIPKSHVNVVIVIPGIADTKDKFEKMLMVFGEMKGEMGLAIKGDGEAKQRLEASKTKVEIVP